jgi:hypothetical protein
MNKVIVLAISALFVSTPAFPAPLQLNYNGQAVAIGQNIPPPPPGCNSMTGDTPLTIAGNEISLVFKNMHLQLRGPGSPMSGRKSCRIVIPTRIDKGFYPTGLKQRLNYRIQKSTGPIGLIQSRAAFIGFPLSTIRIQAGATNSGVQQGIFNSSGTEMTPANIRRWCNTYKNKVFEGNLTIDVSINALRSQASQFININTDGRWRGISEVRACPP